MSRYAPQDYGPPKVDRSQPPFSPRGPPTFRAYDDPRGANREPPRGPRNFANSGPSVRGRGGGPLRGRDGRMGSYGRPEPGREDRSLDGDFGRRDWDYREDRRPSPPPLRPRSPLGRPRSPPFRETREFRERPREFDDFRERPRDPRPPMSAHPLRSYFDRAEVSRPEGEWPRRDREELRRQKSLSPDRSRRDWERPEERREWRDREERFLHRISIERPLSRGQGSSTTNTSSPRTRSPVGRRDDRDDRRDSANLGKGPSSLSIEPRRYDPRVSKLIKTPSSPPQAPAVPAFGSVSALPRMAVPATPTNENTLTSKAQSKLSEKLPDAKKQEDSPSLPEQGEITSPEPFSRSDRTRPSTQLSPGESTPLAPIHPDRAALIRSPTTPAQSLGNSLASSVQSAVSADPAANRPSQITRSNLNRPPPLQPTAKKGVPLGAPSAPRSATILGINRPPIDASQENALNSPNPIQRQGLHPEPAKIGTPLSPAIPTGPKASRASSRGARGAGWRGSTSSPYSSRYPSAPGPTPAKRDRLGDIKAPTAPKGVSADEKLKAIGASTGHGLGKRVLKSKADHLQPEDALPQSQDVVMEDAPSQDIEMKLEGGDNVSSPVADPEQQPSIEDEAESLGDQDFKKSIASMSKEIADLEKQTASIESELSERQKIVRILEEILGASRDLNADAIEDEEMADEETDEANDIVSGEQNPVDQDDVVMSDASRSEPSPPVPSTPSGSARPKYLLHVKTSRRPKETTAVDLPFIRQDPVKLEDLGGLREQAERYDQDKEALIEMLNHARDEEQDELEAQAEVYRDHYKDWRLGTIKREAAERERQRTAELEVNPTSVPQSAITPGRRRATAYGTEYDMERVIAETAAAAETPADDSYPDYEREAVVPDMLTPRQRTEDAVPDISNFVQCEDVWTKFGFSVPRDKLTRSEHEVLVQYLENNPALVKGRETGRNKAFGLLAEQLQDHSRSYRDCIIHYYLSKRTFNWKQYSPLGREERDQAGKPKRGRGKPKPTSSSLVSNLAGKDEQQDDGSNGKSRARLQRKAAPQQFLTSAPILPTPPPEKPSRTRTAGGAGRTPKVAVGLSGSDADKKARKPRSSATKEKGVRKLRTAATAIAPSGSSTTSETAREMFTQPAIPTSPTGRSLEETQTRMQAAELLASFAGGPAQPGIIKNQQDDPRLLPPTGIVPYHFLHRQPGFAPDGSVLPSSERALTPQSMPNPQSTKESPRLQGNSYWSKADKQLFPDLYRRFGSNWEAIASYFEAKTPAMIKNHAMREVERGTLDMQEIAHHSQLRRIAGEPIDPSTASMLSMRSYTQSSGSQQRVRSDSALSQPTRSEDGSLSTRIDPTSPRNTLDPNGRMRYGSQAETSPTYPGRSSLQQSHTIRETISTPLVDTRQISGAAEPTSTASLTFSRANSGLKGTRPDPSLSDHHQSPEAIKAVSSEGRTQRDGTALQFGTKFSHAPRFGQPSQLTSPKEVSSASVLTAHQGWGLDGARSQPPTPASMIPPAAPKPPEPPKRSNLSALLNDPTDVKPSAAPAPGRMDPPNMPVSQMASATAGIGSTPSSMAGSALNLTGDPHGGQTHAHFSQPQGISGSGYQQPTTAGRPGLGQPGYTSAGTTQHENRAGQPSQAGGSFGSYQTQMPGPAGRPQGSQQGLSYGVSRSETPPIFGQTGRRSSFTANSGLATSQGHLGSVSEVHNRSVGQFGSWRAETPGMSSVPGSILRPETARPLGHSMQESQIPPPIRPSSVLQIQQQSLQYNSLGQSQPLQAGTPMGHPYGYAGDQRDREQRRMPESPFTAHQHQHQQQYLDPHHAQQQMQNEQHRLYLQHQRQEEDMRNREAAYRQQLANQQYQERAEAEQRHWEKPTWQQQFHQQPHSLPPSSQHLHQPAHRGR